MRWYIFFFFFSSRRRHTRFDCDWSSDVCSSDLVADVQRRPQAVRVPVDEAEVAMVPATPDPRRLERHAHREPLGALDVVLDGLPRRQARLQEEAVLRREELPVEEVLERPAIDGQQLGSRRELQLAGDGVGRYRLHTNHGTSLPFKDFVRPDVATSTRAVTSKSYQICLGKRDRASRRSVLGYSRRRSASAPDEGHDGAGGEGVAEGLVAPKHGERSVLRLCINDDQRLGAVVRVPEGHAFEPGNAGGRRDTPCAGSYEPAGMRQRVILHVARDGTGGRGDRYHATAIPATACMRSMVLIQREVPEKHPLRPTPRRPDNQGLGEPLEIVREVRRPFAARALGEVSVLVRGGVVHQGLRGHVSAVAVPRDPGDVARRRRVGEHLEGRLILVPIVVPIQDERADAATREERPEILTDKGGARGRLEPHARIGRRLVVGLVLHRDGVDGHPFGAVRLDVAPEVVGEGRVRLGAEGSLDQAAGGLHPARGAPGRRHDLELRVDREGALHDGQNIGAIGIDRKVRQRRIRLARRHVVVTVLMQREVGRAHREAREAQSEPGTGAEQLLQQGFSLDWCQLVLDQPRRRVGDRGPEAHHLLIRRAFVDHDPEERRRRGARIEADVGLPRQQLRSIAGRQPYLSGRPLRWRRAGGRLSRREAPARRDGAECPRRCPHQFQPGFWVRLGFLFRSPWGMGSRLLGAPCTVVSPGAMAPSSVVLAVMTLLRTPQRDRSNQRCPSNRNSRRRSSQTESRNAAVESPGTESIPARVRTALSACRAVMAGTGAPPSFTASAFISCTSAYRSTIQSFDCLAQARWCMFWKSVWSKYLMNAGPIVLGGSVHLAVSPSASTYPESMNVPPRPRVSNESKRRASDGATVMSPYASPPGNPEGRLNSVCTLPAPGSSRPS